MAAPALRNRSGAPISSAIVDALGSRIAGQVVRPQDSGYDDARRIWNAAIERYPGLVVRCAGTRRSASHAPTTCWSRSGAADTMSPGGPSATTAS